MKNICIALCALLAVCACQKEEDTRLIVITIDGMRWQELFMGADSFLVGNPRYVEQPDQLVESYWRPTPEERRETLMPFTWNYIVKHGYLVGNRTKGSQMQVANALRFSYPGYSELFCGYPDDERVNSNEPVDNPNTSVLEAVNADPRYKDSVMVYGTWEAIRHIVNNERGGFKGSVAGEHNISAHPTPELLAIDERLSSLPNGDKHRNDSITFAYAVETLKSDHPKVMWVSFNGTDHGGHDGRYDNYLDAAHKFDQYIQGIVETCEADPFYKGKTTYLVTTDHGRGYQRAFVSHGVGIRGSEQTWMMAFGHYIERLGETTGNGPFYSQQFAATIARVLGVDFTPDNGIRQPAIDPHYQDEALVEELPQTELGHFDAVEAQPVGQGVRYTYHEGAFQSVDELDATNQKGEGVMTNFNIDKALREDGFGFTFSTLLRIDETGRYELTNASDDGAKVWIDGRLVIDDDGSHSTNFVTLFMELEKGMHRLQIKYMEDCEGQFYELQLNGPGLTGDAIPDGMLYYE